MADIRDYCTEAEAARLLGLKLGKGRAWEYLDGTGVEVIEIFDMKAVKRSDVLRVKVRRWEAERA